ncbi:MAG: hypothetical protein ACXVPN_07460 [Bacteroidia bacterium]
MKHYLTLSLLIALMIGSLKSQQSSNFAGISDKLAFDESQPLNKELSNYFSDPHNAVKAAEFFASTDMINCTKEIHRKNYWHTREKNNQYMMLFSCKKDKSPFFVCFEKNEGALKASDLKSGFLQISSDVEEKGFGKNNFVGKNIKDLISRFGNTYIKKDIYLVYGDYNDKILLFIVKDEKITFFKYVWMNKTIKSFEDLDRNVFSLK